MDRLIENLFAQIQKNGKGIVRIFHNRDYSTPDIHEVETMAEGIELINWVMMSLNDDIEIPHPNSFK